ncbi:hypothetical protein [Halomonas halocynthiae]|uniref:hypothetical protein n=1 Tax=Halomonas halocynthiae TaxID=176290 RepID=UPI00196A066C|nr:hypothetical protein [Halomonas halocynthiae]
MSNKLVTSCVFALFSMVSAIPVAAQDEWVGQVTPYVWAIGVSGDLTPFKNGPSLSFSRSFSESRKDVDGAFFLSGFARKNRLVMLADISYSSSSRDGNIRPGISAEGELKQRSMTLAAGWRVLQEETWALDALAGARHWNIRSSIKVAGAFGAGIEKNFTDPIVALRGNIQLAPRWSTIAYLDVGGFGVGSEHTVQGVLTANYHMSDSLFVSGGYRFLDFDYRSGGTELNWNMHGPMLGLTWRF